MKTFVIVSDSHGHVKTLEKLYPLFAENDFIVHLGDGRGDILSASRAYPEKVYSVKGNCDWTVGEEEGIIEAEGVSVFYCHGHKYGVKSGLDRLAMRAKEKGCEVALYGHTHVASVQEVDGVLCINPGAIASFTQPSYCYMVIHNGKVTATVVNI